MKKYLSVLATLALLFACTEETVDPNGGNETPDGDKTVHVTGVSLDRTSVTIKEGESVTLVATVKPENADNKTISWSSSDAAVASVDNSGKVTGVKAGSATVTAKTEDGEKTASCVVTVEPNLAPSVTVGADNISAISVVLRGKANLGSTAASDLTMGIMWSENAGVLPSNSTKVEATNMDGDYNYSVNVTGLEPAKTYYYRSYFTQNGQDTYGETKEFKTRDVESLIETIEATSIEAAEATLSAKLDLTDVQYNSITYGFYWGTSESSQNTFLKGGDIANLAFTAVMSNLSHKTQYWYKAYVKLDSQAFYGEAKSFTTDVVKVESVSLNITEITIYNTGHSFTLNATVLPVDADEKSVEWISSNPEVAIINNSGSVMTISNGSTIITATTIDQNKTASCVLTVAEYFTATAGEAVDLGLSVKWSNVNLGANSPNQRGAYFAWGETEPYYQFNYSSSNWRYGKSNGYDDGSYKWYNGSYKKCTKYCPSNCVNSWDGMGEPDNKSSFSDYNYEDDAARMVLGEGWRVPTIAEWKELLDNCTWTWKETYEFGSLVLAGMKVTSNKPGYTDKSIFLPAAGRWRGKNNDVYSWKYGHYWSSDLANIQSGEDGNVAKYARSLCFYYTNMGNNIGNKINMTYQERPYGLSIRPVTD